MVETVECRSSKIPRGKGFPLSKSALTRSTRMCGEAEQRYGEWQFCETIRIPMSLSPLKSKGIKRTSLTQEQSCYLQLTTDYLLCLQTSILSPQYITVSCNIERRVSVCRQPSHGSSVPEIFSQDYGWSRIPGIQLKQQIHLDCQGFDLIKQLTNKSSCYN